MRACVAVALLALALPLSSGHIGEEIPQQHARAEPSPALATAPAPALEAVLGRKSGGGALLPSRSVAPGPSVGLPSVPAPAPEAGLAVLGAGSSLGSGTGTEASSGADVTMPAAGGSEFDLTGTLFAGNAQAFTQAVLASGELMDCEGLKHEHRMDY